jgi:GGDEF domain-containing protein
MTPNGYLGESRLLTPGALQFVLNRELRRAVRSHNVLTLVVVRADRDRGGSPVPADDRTLQEIGQLLEREMRENDLVGYLEPGLLALVLLNTDYGRTERLVDRLIESIETHPFPVPVRVVIGAACYPTHAMGAASLRRWAVSHPIVTCRGGSRSAAHH